MKETVNHPDHYGGDKPYEVIKVLEAWNPLMAYHFCVGNTIKYQVRAGKKDDEVEDIRKAAWYACRAEEILVKHPNMVRILAKEPIAVTDPLVMLRTLQKSIGMNHPVQDHLARVINHVQEGMAQ